MSNKSIEAMVYFQENSKLLDKILDQLAEIGPSEIINYIENLKKENNGIAPLLIELINKIGPPEKFKENWAAYKMLNQEIQKREALN